MKTDPFDDEFRRKLLGLPADTDPGEVTRILKFVRTHQPGPVTDIWGKLLVVGVACVFFIGSLTYNFIQTYRNTHLQASLDSLTFWAPHATTVLKHDTVYIAARSGKHTSGSRISIGSPENARQQDVAKLENKSNSLGDLQVDHHGLPDRFTEVNSQPESTSIAIPLNDQFIIERSSAGRIQAKERAHGPLNQPKEGRDLTVAEAEDTGPLTDRFRTDKHSSAAPLRSTAWRSNRQTVIRSTELVPSTLPVDVLTTSKEQHLSKTDGRNNNISQSISPAGAETKNGISQILAPERLTTRPLDQSFRINSTLLAKRSVVVPHPQEVIRRTRQRWHLALPTLSASSPSYRIGSGLTAGTDDQLGVSLLGEVVLNQHWSLQAGIRGLFNQGFQYRNDRDFDDHQDDDFRQTYASQVPLSSDIQDISQVSVMVQVPVQLAYHYPLNRQWGLRLGVGTDLDVWVRSAVSYKFQESSRSQERSYMLMETPVHVLNNLTINPSVDWNRKRWLFRAGPSISPQLRSVSYKPDDLSWGANVQILYRLGK